jgi:hypothetical protein
VLSTAHRQFVTRQTSLFHFKISKKKKLIQDFYNSSQELIMTAAVVASMGRGADDDALRSRLGVGRKLHRLRTPLAAGGESARRTSSRFPFPVGTRAGGLLAALLPPRHRGLLPVGTPPVALQSA